MKNVDEIPVEGSQKPEDQPIHQEWDESVFEHVDSVARIAVYDNLLSSPRIIDIQPNSTRAYIDDIATTVYTAAKESGGAIPYSIILQVAENFIHSYFSEIVVTIINGGNTIRFSDQGPGIADKQKVKSPGFSSATAKMKKTIDGVGSGLPIVSEYMETMHGSIKIEDNVDSGAVITISLNPDESDAGATPAQDEAQRAQAQEQAQAQGATQGQYAQTTQQMQAVQPIQPIQIAATAQPMQSTQLLQTEQPVQSMQPAQVMQPVQQTQAAALNMDQIPTQAALAAAINPAIATPTANATVAAATASNTAANIAAANTAANVAGSIPVEPIAIAPAATAAYIAPNVNVASEPVSTGRLIRAMISERGMSILRLFEFDDIWRVTDISSELDLAASTVHNELKKLEEAGMVAKLGKKRVITELGAQFLNGEL